MTESEARDEMFTLVETAWNAGASAIAGGYLPEIRWQGKEPKDSPSADQAFCRVTAMHASRRQATLAGDAGTKRWANAGVLMVQCFGPLSGGNGLTVGEALAKLVKDVFEGKSSPGGIWFRNCRTNEVGPSDGWYQVNAVAEFLYDEVR